ncbi:LPXTG-motif cell wall-anchored protein [Marmoricola sp. URHA0025 HA25]
MSFGTSKSWRLCSPFVALLWALLTVAFAAPAQAEDTHGTANQSPVATSATSDAAGHPTGPPAGAGTTERPATQPVTPVTPQPISTADANAGGANGQCPDGPYCSTTDGTASANGNGGGQATGKPCAGCVGKADNKNPHGQLPNASDHNAGYECDTNHGIARGNPAHSGCLQAPPEVCPTDPCVPPCATEPCVPPCVTEPCVPPCVTEPCVPPCVTEPCVPPCVTEPCVPLPPCPTDPCAPPPPCPTGTCVSPPIVGSAAPNPSASVAPPLRVLPNTGAPAGLVWLTAAALASIVAGATLLLRRGGSAVLPPS